MLHSMTGYGSDKFTISDTAYEIIITSLNSKILILIFEYHKYSKI